MKQITMELNLEEMKQAAGGLSGDDNVKLSRIPWFANAMKYYGEEIKEG